MNDWIRLLVKYKGKCSVCGKEISAGEYAFWSKSSKMIKHSECEAPLPVTTGKSGTDKNRQHSTETINVNCFICSMPIAITNSRFETDNYGRQALSQAYICNTCLEDKNAFQNYQHAFIERVRRATKLMTWTYDYRREPSI